MCKVWLTPIQVRVGRKMNDSTGYRVLLFIFTYML